MLVYRNAARRVETRRELARLARLEGRTALTNLIEISEFEAAVADALMPARDGLHPIASALRAASPEAARVWISDASPPTRDTAGMGARVAALLEQPLPPAVLLRVS